MLDPNKLKGEIKKGIQTIVVPAIEETIKVGFPDSTELDNETAKAMAATFDELVSDPLAEVIAKSIHYYIRNMSIHGLIITKGSPTIQVANVNSKYSPMFNGFMPNTLGVK